MASPHHEPDGNMSAPCSDCVRTYMDALHAGSHVEIGDSVSCLTALELLQPAPDDPGEYVPIRPLVALSILARPIEREIAQRQTEVTALYRILSPLEEIYAAAKGPGMRDMVVIEGLAAINAALDQAIASCRVEVMTAQPGGGRSDAVLAQALARSIPLMERGVQFRTLYQHTARFSQATVSYVEQFTALGGEVRTIVELSERLLIFDRAVAYIPARPDRKIALEVRHPGLIDFLVGVFEVLWNLGSPFIAGRGPRQAGNVIPEIRRTIAELLIAGHTDEAIARRLGLSVRTCRSHIASISRDVGSNSRAQLGYLLASTNYLSQSAP
jgi:hypothetical protein